MANVLYNEGEEIKTVKHKDLKAGDVFCYPLKESSIFMKIEMDGELHTVDLKTGKYFYDISEHCLEADVIKLDALIFASADNSKKEVT